MSQKTKTALIIGGIALAAIVVCGVIAVIVLPLGGAGVANQAIPAAEPLMDRGGYAVEEEAAMEAPVAAEASAVDDGMGGGGMVDVTAGNVDESQTQQIERLIIRNGNITISVNDTRQTKDEIERLVAQYAGQGAFVVSSNASGSSRDGMPYINMAIRVPAEQFDTVMDALEGMAVEGTSPMVSESAQDVTEEYVDVQARTESLEAARERLLELMEGANTTEDLLQAEQQLTQREVEIESLKARIRYLEDSARLSRIDITLEPYILSQPVDTRWRPAETVREAFSALVDALRDFGDFLIFAVIALLPWLLLVAVIVYAGYRLVAWRVRVARERREAKAGPAEEG
jgi:hypothetical protein